MCIRIFSQTSIEISLTRELTLKARFLILSSKSNVFDKKAHVHSSIKRECLFCFSLASNHELLQRLTRTTVRSLDEFRNCASVFRDK
ncbi:CDC42 small effector protein Spec2 isoform X3 [Augochlora pura]